MNFNYVYIAATLGFTVYGQLILKWQVGNAGAIPASTPDRISYLVNLVLNPWVLSALVGGFLAALSWMAALTKFELSHAYPFMALSFAFVLVLSAAFFSEPVTAAKIAGVVLIGAGVIVGSAL